MTRMTLALSGALTLLLAGPAAAQVTTGGAGNTGVTAPPTTGGVGAGTVGNGPNAQITTGTTANPSNSSVPGTTPGVNIGGTPTSGPPGTGGTAGGPALGNR
ncbi:hypothetical protein WYO_4283 [Methylobacterium sp. GXF4]|jgi:hypothetical protein|uniref:Collagen type III alpha n=1 Tax=Methylobacterium brachiatum TaxID=269660 RepID=A0AAJ1WWC9_9HYPH|nr:MULTISPECIES: hypothetical protein [Methylobacterium]EIZ82990.1 hypothetical protein WYO_4283 [Methylobacterium sp. GXF4]MCB4802482.1 hypothetical protein [Methylobacterium brachiatum]MDQ0543105.1 collagen type III alpha [Methylobacterium brachiatum]